MKIYRLNDYEWWMARSLEEVFESRMKETGCSHTDVFDEEGSISPLSDAELDSLRFIESQPDCDAPAGGWPERTFREELALRVAAGDGAGIFAGTEC